MLKKYEDEYKLLINQRSKVDNSDEIIKTLKRNVWEYFRSNGCINSDIEQNMLQPVSIYIAPLKKIHGSRMVCWPLQKGYEIYVDDEFLKQNSNNALLINCQLTHEIIHSVIRMKNNNPFKFGHEVLTMEDMQNSRNLIDRVDLTAFDEACTQIVAEDVNGTIIDRETDSYYLIKNIMRQFITLIGKDKMLDQFCNNNTAFEDAFNIISNNKFYEFAEIMAIIHNLEKELKNNNISDQERNLINRKLDIHKGHIDDFITNKFGTELISKQI